jgi:enoyl-CoA hydratase/carnithine racemase
MSETPVLYETFDSVAWIRLNRPEAQNMITPALFDGLSDALNRAHSDNDVRVVVLTGVGSAFCAGADVAAVAPPDSQGRPPKMGDRLARSNLIFGHLESIPKPVIAALNGITRAGGLELMLCCDLVVAARSAMIGEGHAVHGQLPGGGGSIRLPRKIGVTQAKYLLFTGALVPAQTFFEWGGVNEVVDDDKLIDTVTELATLLAKNSSESIRRMKHLVNDGVDQPLESALRMEILAVEAHRASQL